jgi:hypothetical protein
MKAYYKAGGLAALCALFGKCRQAFYEQKRQEEKELFQAAIIVDLGWQRAPNCPSSGRAKPAPDIKKRVGSPANMGRARRFFRGAAPERP